MSRLELNVALLMPPDPIRTQSYQDTLTCIRPANDSEGPPPKGPGDAIVIVSALVGLVLGAGAGVAVGYLAFGSSLWLISVVVSTLLGTAAGALIGDTIKKHSGSSSPQS